MCQDNYLSALLFILCLAFAVKLLPPVISAFNNPKPLWSVLDWIIDQDINKITIDPKYADDISFLRSDKSEINQVEREIPAMLLTESFYIKMKAKRKGITYKEVEKMRGRNANIWDHYLTAKKISKGKKGLKLIHTRHSNLFSAANTSVKNSDKSICNIHPKYLHVQLGTLDVDTNSGKQHRFVSKEAAKKNYQCQMAKVDLQ